jgi:glycerol-3-phosphate acyltransferase PlsX
MVEGRDIAAGTTDVVVCDGFVGNVAVKLMEGAGAAMTEFFAKEISERPLYRAAAYLLRRPLERLRRRMSYDSYGGAPLLGVAGNVVVCHGRSNAKAIGNGIKVARDLSSKKVDDKIRKAIEDLKQTLETAKI